MTTQRVEILVGDEFDTTTGEFTNYDAVPDGQRPQFKAQKHTDIRSFVQTDVIAPINMLYLDLLGMANLDLKTMNDLDGNVVVRYGERWVAGSVGPQADRNHWQGISFACTTANNPNTTQSVLVT